MTFNKQVLAQVNKKNVLEIIRTKGPINKAEIANITKLSIPTIMKICDEFAENHLIQSVGKRESTGGKKPELIRFAEDAYYMIGVDIGRSQVKVIVMDMGAKIIIRKNMKSEQVGDANQFFTYVIRLIQEVCEEKELTEGRILGIGLAIPGLLDVAKGKIVFSPDFGWENIDVVSMFKKTFRTRIYLENANRAMTVGEKWFGVGTGAGRGSIFGVNWGHGIGAAIIGNDGKILHGSCGSIGEFGHITLEKDGPLCDCGNRGCLEALSSGNAIVKEMCRNIELGKYSKVMNIVGNDISKIEAKHIFDAARAGDELSITIIDEAVEYFGIGLASIINLIDPERVIICGGIMKSSDLFYEKLKEVIKSHQMKYAGRNVSIVKGKLGDDATAIGAASLILKEFIDYGGDIAQRNIGLA